MSDSNAHRLVWDKFSKGDENALLEMYHQHYTGLINYGRTLINDHEFVNGCFIDMLVEFWKKRATLAQVENVRSYLLTSFRRFLLDKLEAEKKRDATQNKFQQFSEPHQISYEEHLVRLQSDERLKSKISKALGRLTERQLELVRLKFFEDLDYDEIAATCGITKRTAYNIIYDALKILKEELNDGRNESFSAGFLAIVMVIIFNRF